MRCAWVPADDRLYQEYHDREWGAPLTDERRLFEKLVLEGFQAGLSWRTILYKRENFRRGFANFDLEAVARFGADDVKRLLGDPGIVRHKGKIAAAINNARRALELRDEAGGLAQYFWTWVDGKPIDNVPASLEDIPAQTELSAAISKDLKKRGFKFVGPTTVYAFMQGVGLVNDHTKDCFRRKELPGGPVDWKTS